MQQPPKLDLFDLYFDYVAGTEPPAVFHRWSLVGCVSALLGRQFWFPFGDGRIFANQYIMFVGEPGTRKSTAIKKACKLLRASGYDFFGAQKTSMEKFLLDLQDGLDGDEVEFDSAGTGRGKKKEAIDILANLNLKLAGDTDNVIRETFVAADEFNNFLGSGNLAFQSLLGELWDWDEPTAPYKQRLKTSKSVSIYQPTVTILAGNTPSSFADCFPVASIGQGFMSRLILIHSDPSGIKVTIPSAPPEQQRLAIIEHLRRIKQVVIGAATVEPEAIGALDLIYKGWVDMEDTRFRHYSSRRLTHLIKLTLVCAACRLSSTITVRDVIYANTILHYAETTMPKAIGELGTSKSSQAANKIMQVLYPARDFVTHRELYKVVRNDLNDLKELSPLLIGLEQSEKIFSGKNSKGETGYLARQKPMSRQNAYTNLDLLKGREFK